MHKHFQNILMGISVFPALLIMPAVATDYTSEDIETYPYLVSAGDSLTVTNGYSDAENGVFKNQGSLTINNGLVFDNNKTQGWGGTLHIYSVNATSTTIGNNVTFSGGTALEGSPDYEGMAGAIYTWSDGTADGANVITMGNNVTFRGNSAYDGGAIYTYGYNTITVGDNLVVEDNFAANGGGGIVLNGYDGFHGKDFVNTLTIGKNALFKGNTSLLRAGAIYIGGDANDKAVLGDGAVFSGNASSFGGAVSGFGTFEFGDVSFDSNVSYNAWEHVIKDWGWTEDYYNGYVGNGGAIVNRGDVVITGKANFVNNYAEGQGGAIYNKGTMTFLDDVSFSGNKQGVSVAIVEDEDNFNGFVLGTVTGGIANDIYNAGDLNIESGTTTMDGGIDGTGSLVIADGATLNIGTASIVQGTITLDGTLIATLRAGDNAQLISGDAEDSFSGNGTLKLAIRGADTYHVFGENVFANSEIESSVYDWKWSDDGKDLIASIKSVENVVAENNLTTETAIAVVNLASSSSEQLNNLAVAIQNKLSNKTDEARAEVEQAQAAIHPETKSVVQSLSSSVQNTVTSLASGRMSIPYVGRNGGDVEMTSGGVWVHGIYNKAKQNDAFNGYTRGIAGGMDATFNKVWTMGAGYAFAHSDVSGNTRDTEIDSSTLFVYGQYKPGAWYMNAIANYTMSDYSETGSALGIGLSGDYDVDSFGANIATGYDFAGGITPELALRYMHINSTDYISSLGIKNELNDADYLTASVGTKYAFDIKASKHTKLRPELRYAIKYDLMSDKQVATVTMPGVDSYALNGDRLSRIGGEFGIGLGMLYRGWDMSLNYDIEAREDYTSQTGRVKFRYNF